MAETKTTWKIYWWAKVGGKPKKYGSDVITIDGHQEPDAETILEQNANGVLGYHDAIELRNFSDYYVNADHCLDFGLVKIKQVKEH